MLMHKLKTWLFLLALTAVALYLGEALGGRQGLLVAFVISMGMNFVSYFYSDKIALWTYNARPLEGADLYGLNKIVGDLAIRAGIPKPKVYLIPSETPNAFATGRSPQNASVAATEGLLRLLSKEEIKAVMAHEISHVINRDTFIMMVAATLGSIIMYLANVFKWTALLGNHSGSSDRDNPGGAASHIVLALVAPIAAILIQMAVSRNREYMADLGSKELTKDPEALASALWKIHHYAESMPLTATAATSHLFIINPLTGGGLANLFSTHPPVEERIKRLTGRAP